jgi:hypothetical protein
MRQQPVLARLGKSQTLAPLLTLLERQLSAGLPPCRISMDHTPAQEPSQSPLVDPRGTCLHQTRTRPMDPLSSPVEDLPWIPSALLRMEESPTVNVGVHRRSHLLQPMLKLLLGRFTDLPVLLLVTSLLLPNRLTCHLPRLRKHRPPNLPQTRHHLLNRPSTGSSTSPKGRNQQTSPPTTKALLECRSRKAMGTCPPRPALMLTSHLPMLLS